MKILHHTHNNRAMNYFKTITILFAFVSFAHSSVYFGNQGRQKRDTSSAVTIRTDDEEVYQYGIGERPRASLLEQCSFHFVTITYVKGDRIGFASERSFPAASSDVGAIELIYTKPQRDARFNSESGSALDFVYPEVGGNLFVSKCKGSNDDKSYKPIVSNEKYFCSVEYVIKFDASLRQNPDRLAAIPQILDSQNDLIFAGYAIAVFRTGKAINSPAMRATVLGQILESSKVPYIGLWYARFFLRLLLVSEAEDALAPETRDSIIERLVAISSRKDVKANVVFLLLLELAERDKLDISRFLNQENRTGFTANYHIFIRNNPDLTGRAAFERHLNNGKKSRN